MSEPVAYALLILGLLLGAAILTAITVAVRSLKDVANWPLIAACAASAFVADRKSVV